MQGCRGKLRVDRGEASTGWAGVRDKHRADFGEGVSTRWAEIRGMDPAVSLSPLIGPAVSRVPSAGRWGEACGKGEDKGFTLAGQG